MCLILLIFWGHLNFKRKKYIGENKESKNKFCVKLKLN